MKKKPGLAHFLKKKLKQTDHLIHCNLYFCRCDSNEFEFHGHLQFDQIGLFPTKRSW